MKARADHNRKFSKDSGLAEVESKILPQVIRTETEDIMADEK
jgi:hypothetical protein